MTLLERQSQLELLTSYLDEAATRAGKIVFVCGEAGAGKSALVEEFTHRLTRKTGVLWGHCDALQTSRVLGPVNEVAAGLAQRSGASLPSHSSREQLFANLPGALCFRHELGRLAVASTVSPGRAGELHRKILRCLIERNSDLSQIVHHAIHSEDAQVLLEYAPRAARHAASAGAHREAAAHLATAIRHGNALSAPELANLLEMHAVECDLTNQVSSSLESATRAAQIWREQANPTAQARMLLMIGTQHWKSGRKAQADQPVADAIALLETLPPSRELAMAYSARSQRAMTSHQTSEALEFGQRALDLARRFEDPGVRSHALNNIGSVLINTDVETGVARLKESLKVALDHDLQVHAGRAYANLVSLAVDLHLDEVAARFIPEGAEYCELHEVQDCLSYIRAFAAQQELNHGAWNTAGQMAGQLVERYSLAVAQRLPALIVLCLVRARRGDPGVDGLLSEALELAMPTGEAQRIGPVACAGAEIAWYRGDLEEVRRQVTVGLEAVAGRSTAWIRGELAFWGHRADPSLRTQGVIAQPYALMVRGDWQGAAAIWHTLGMPYHRALALADGPEEALREALDILEKLGAGPLGAIVRQRLRERGVRGIPRGPRSSTRENPAGLTSREVQVLSLLVKGHTNTELARRLHVSARTVDHHVSSILEKLEVRSRTEAVAAAFGLGLVKD